MTSPISQFIAWATGTGANTYTGADYIALPTDQQGFQAGRAASKLANTALRQATTGMAMLGEFMRRNQNSDVLDDGNITALEAQFENALSSVILSVLKANSTLSVQAFVNIYVRWDSTAVTPDGSVNDATHAFPNPAAAILYGLTKFSFNGLFGINVLLGLASTPGTPSTYYAPPGLVRGSTTINITGDLANQANYIISGSGIAGSGLIISNGSQLNLNGITVQNTSNIAHCVGAVTGGSLGMTNVTLTQTLSNPTYASVIALGGNVVINGGCILNGGTWYSALDTAYSGANITIASNLTVINSPAYTIFAHARDTANIIILGTTISGSATGSKYNASQGGIIDTGGAGANYFPGSTAGATATGGQYV